MNGQNTISDTMSIGEYAKAMLGNYENPIATDRMDALLYMTVGAGRMRLLNRMTETMYRQLGLDGTGAGARRLTTMMVLGEFGSGKSHLGYMLKHNAMRCGHELLVSHVQVTDQADFPQTIAALLRSLRVAGVQSLDQLGVELSAYIKMHTWAGRNVSSLERVLVASAGNVDRGVVREFALAVDLAARSAPEGSSALQRWLDRRIAGSQNAHALERFEMVLRAFSELKSNRYAVLIDEFEAIRGFDEAVQKQILQGYQSLVDDFLSRRPGLPRTYMGFFSTPVWYHEVDRLLPSLSQRLNYAGGQVSIPNVDSIDVAALMYRYLGLYQLVYENLPELSPQVFNAACEEVWKKVAGEAFRIRQIHFEVREKLRGLLRI